MPTDDETPVTPDPRAAALIEYIRDSVIGDDEATDGPFGPRRVTYADYTASGRSLTFIEDYLRAAVLPRYANTHTESSGTGRQTSRFREEARHIIATAVGADPVRHAVIFAGSGSTGAIHKLVDVLGLRLPSELDERYALRDQHPGRRATGGVHRTLRAPLQRAAVAGVHRGPGDHPRGRRRAYRPGAPGAGAGPVRRPPTAHRLLLGRLQRHRHPVRHPRRVRAAPPSWRTVAVGLRGRGALRGHRDGAPSAGPGR